MISAGGGGDGFAERSAAGDVVLGGSVVFVVAVNNPGERSAEIEVELVTFGRRFEVNREGVEVGGGIFGYRRHKTGIISRGMY